MEGTRIDDRYEIVRQLGQGGFGRTLLAQDLRLNRPVAIKVLHPRPEDGLKSYELFEREAAVLRELRHPAVPAVHAFFRAPWNGAASAAFLVMEYIEGTSFAEVITDRRHLDPDQVLHLLLELLGVLDYLHTRMPPVLHRDIKPSNLIIRPDGSPALVDFGAVRNIFRPPDESGSTVVGTYGYMPYEQYMGQASPASDLFALGATFLHLVTGRAPPQFMGPTGRLEVPTTLPCGEPLRTVLARLLAAAPADRYQSAREARSALLRLPAPAVEAEALVIAPAHPLAPYEQQPRELRGPLRDLFQRTVYSPWWLMNTTVRPSHGTSPFMPVLVVFLSIVTVGILPAVFWNIYFTRKRRLKPFFRAGQPGTARVIDLQKEEIGFGEALTRVRYEFEADGRRHRGSDQVLPLVAEWWESGTMINVLYLPDRGYDSVIVAPLEA
jgi:serine/threonine protein kinase